MTATTPRHAPLAMDAQTFRTLGHSLVDQLAGLLAAIPDKPLTRDLSPSAVRDALDLNGALPEKGTDPAALLSDTAAKLFDHSLFNAHPRFFGYITAPPAPIGILADFLASALNANVGAWTLSPAATEVEAQCVRWIGELIGMPKGGAGVLVSGGNQANTVCFLAARAAAAPWDVRAEGLRSDRPLLVYASRETHTWIHKATDISGLGTNSIRWIDTGPDLTMDVTALRTAIDEDLTAGRVPFMVVGTAGSVSTGAVDPLPQIAALCREKKIWFHVDGAYGGFAAAVPEASADLRGLAEADSVAVDPHKWLYAPIEAGCALVRDPEALTRAFSYHPPYYHFNERAVNFVDYGPQNSRGFRALKVWMALRHAGAAGYRTMIADDISLSRAMAEAVKPHPELEFMTQALSITTFRYVPKDLRARTGDEKVEAYLNTLNETLVDALQKGGQVFLSNAVIQGRYLLRACIVNFHTQASDVEAIPGIVAEQGRAVDRASRPQDLA